MDPQALLRHWFDLESDIAEAVADGDTELADYYRTERQWAEADYANWIANGGAMATVRPVDRSDDERLYGRVYRLQWPTLSVRRFGAISASRVTLL